MSETPNIVSRRTIAEMAGVARSTVTMALNRDPRILIETHDRITRIAEQLNYNPYFQMKPVGLLSGGRQDLLFMQCRDEDG